MGNEVSPGQVLGDAVVLPGDVQPREGRAWLVDWAGTRGVLRSAPTPADPAALSLLAADLTWLHRFLDWLAATGFPSPRPLPAFGGRSWTVVDSRRWELLSFLPGQVVAWADHPSMEEIGALLGRYHNTVRRYQAPSQRPGALPLSDVPAVLGPLQLQVASVDQDLAAIIGHLADRLASDLAVARRLDHSEVVMHGDFTNHNVLADGASARVTGVIDFALAHVEVPLADIGYGLWRSGRPHQAADHVDLTRVRQFLRGYASTARISADRASVIPIYMYGRGLQMIAKRIRAGSRETGMLAQVRWLAANAAILAETCADAVRS